MLVWCGGTLLISIIMDKKRNYVAPEVEVAVNIDVTVGVVQMSKDGGKGDKVPTDPDAPDIDI